MVDGTESDARVEAIPITVISSFRADAPYAHNFLKSLLRWPATIKFKIFYHDGALPKSAPVMDNVEYIDLTAMPDRAEFMTKFPGMNGTMDGQTPYNWRMDAIKFSNKVFALLHAAGDDCWLIWLDADTAVKKDITEEWLRSLLDVEADVVTLERKAVPYSETSFVAFNMTRSPARHLLADLGDTYMTGELFHYREWHDGFVFERLYRLHKMHGLRGKTLYAGTEMAAFDNSPLAEYMTHDKGEKKNIFGRRYGQILQLLRQYKPSHLCEVGTWNGGRAVEMMRTVLEYRDDVHYDGFDLFEDATGESDTLELNTKKPHTVKMVNNVLKMFAEDMAKRGKRVTFKLNKGNTNETLRDYQGTPDFAYIDGGHSIDTAVSDYRHLMQTPVVVMDDYFSADDADMGPEEEHCGTNYVVERLAEKRKIHILPSEDRVVGGGITHLAVILQTDQAEPAKVDKVMAPFIVVPKDCVEKDDLRENILRNMEMIDRWVDWCKPHADLGIIASAGPSLAKTMETIKAHVDGGNPNGTLARVMAVKHSYPTLLKAGIVPWGCIVLDPRSINGTSTHGIVRTELFKNIHPDTIWFVSSMTNPEVTEMLIKEGARIMGWHAYSNTALKLPEIAGHRLITGGTCAAMRSIGLMHTLGFRKLHLHGYDSCTEGVPKDPMEKTEDGKPKWLKVELNGREFWTTGELVAQAQDFEKLLEREDNDYELTVFGDGIVQEMWKSMRRLEPPNYEEFLR